MIIHHQYNHLVPPPTEFNQSPRALHLLRLFGVGPSLDRQDVARSTRDLWVLTVDGETLGSEDLDAVEVETDAGYLSAVWQLSGGLEWAMSWTPVGASDIWIRRDRLTNRGSMPVAITHVAARISLGPAVWEAYTQSSLWCRENQGRWLTLDSGETHLTARNGRTTEGGTPYVALRPRGDLGGLSIHLAPLGDWRIALRARERMFSEPFLEADWGPATEGFCWRLAPGEVLELPVALFQHWRGSPEEAAPRLHRHLLAERAELPGPPPPLVYNTWFDRHSEISIHRLREQLAAAHEVGCEAFVVDAGWFGQEPTEWWREVGNWTEGPGLWPDTMLGFAQEVRAMGLGFGFWVEPERVGPEAPILAQRPDWFLPSDATWSEYAAPDLANPEAAQWMLDELRRLFLMYDPAWVKLDFNWELPRDRSGRGHAAHYAALYRIYDALRDEFPGTFVEGCASGGLRTDLRTMSHVHAHFLSDSVNPTDVLRILPGAALRLLPARLSQWMVVRPDPMEHPKCVLTPDGAGWGRPEVCQLKRAFLSNVTGVLGISGDLAGLDPSLRQLLAGWIETYKRFRGHFFDAELHLLSPMVGLEDRVSPVALQAYRESTGVSVIIAIHVAPGAASMRIYPRGLQPSRVYGVATDWHAEPEAVGMSTGEELMRKGLDLNFTPEESALTVMLWPADPE